MQVKFDVLAKNHHFAQIFIWLFIHFETYSK